jgi:hypothetical protein
MTKRYPYCFFLLLIAFLAGVHFAYTKHWPYHFLRQIGIGAISQYQSNGDGFYQEMFSDELIARDRLFPDVHDRAALVNAVDAMAAPRVDIRGVGTALNLVGTLTTRKLPQDGTEVSSIAYTLDGRQIEVYAYRLGATNKPSSAAPDCGTLIIPGSGRDQGLTIIRGDTRNYHFGILEPFITCDVYVLIKPNEGYLSIARNGMKLTEYAYIHHLIGIGSSYSSRYVTDAIAFTMELKRRYRKTIVTGLSQGGAAAVLVGIEARPNITVAASGLMEITRDLGYGGYNSALLFPGLQRAIFRDWLPERLRVTDVDFLILGGVHDGGLAGQDAREGWTCNMLADMPNVKCLSHSGGHIYPSEVVKNYLTSRSHR